MKVEEDLALCKNVNSLEAAQKEISRSLPIEREDNKQPSSFVANDSRWLDDIDHNDDNHDVVEREQYSKDWSHISHESKDSLARSQTSFMDPWMTMNDSLHYESPSTSLQRGANQHRTSRESMSELLSRYSQDRVVRPYNYHARYSTNRTLDESSDLQDIFHDIGRLSQKLETRIRSSQQSNDC
jgi:hypothetical protein